MISVRLRNVMTMSVTRRVVLPNKSIRITPRKRDERVPTCGKGTLAKETILAPFAETVNDRYARWLSEQEAAGSAFTPEQRQWLGMIRDQIAISLAVETDDFDYVPFSERGGLGKAYALFGDRLPGILKELNEVLAA